MILSLANDTLSERREVLSMNLDYWLAHEVKEAARALNRHRAMMEARQRSCQTTRVIRRSK